MTKKLAICIPTYNRAKCLDFTLEQIEKQGQDIQVCISDNASPDNTREIVEKHMKTLDIKYSRNEENLGFDVNLTKVIMLADAEFIWTMGDDDIILDGGIKQLVSDVERVEPGTNAIYVNSFVVEGNACMTFGFSDFRHFDVANSPLMKINQGFNVFCMRTETAKEYMRKHGADRIYMEFWQQNRMFMECVKSTMKIAIEPKPLMQGLQAIADLNTYKPQSNKGVMKDEPLYLRYELARMNDYSWFPYKVDSMLTFARSEIRRSVLAYKEPELKTIKDECTVMYRKICARRHAQEYAMLTDAIALCMPVVSFIYDIKRKVLRQKVYRMPKSD